MTKTKYLATKKRETSHMNTVHLSEDLLLGTGAHRKCYRHPSNENQCIKIIYNLEDGGEKEIIRELKFYREMSLRLKDWTSITKYYGQIHTNLGVGYLYDNIKNKDGSASPTLTDYLSMKGASETLESALLSLYNYLKNNKIPTMTIKPQNVLCQMNGEDIVKLVIVDNLGESTLIPLSKISIMIFNQRLNKKWSHFIQSVGI